MSIDKALLTCLDAIEEKEIEMIVWGDTNVLLTRDEILHVISQFIDVYEVAEDVLSELKGRALVFESELPNGETGYRSRMAETVHLQANLRQWFHNHELETTKSLVSDYRFVRRPRRYPKRDFPAVSLIEGWANKLNLTHEQVSILNYLLVEGKKDFNLAGFQVRATERILDYYKRHTQKVMTPSATIVCAGTGSGKTMAFYLPAMTQLAEDLLNNCDRRVRILAIYPRNELLKDQFSETYEQARLLDDYMQSHGSRKIKIGTFFGDTFSDYKVRNSKHDLLFSTMPCPKCKGQLHWCLKDRHQEKEELTCNVCSHKVGADELGISRNSQLKSPPDILFTTTEMLNQRLGDNEFNRLFGVGVQQSIPLVLLDEVHTYEGATGAQTSYLFKRWMKRSQNRPHFVGLSATLSDPVGFFSDLTGVPQNLVELVQSLDSEMEDEGAEYLLALRGDAVSQSALLSTTIQSTMLTHRMLDAQRGASAAISQGVYGTKAFVFTDDLDVINRLYDQVLDAEGSRHYRGTQQSLSRPSLAYLRSPQHPDHNALLPLLCHLGQNWSNAEHIGHNVSDTGRAVISKTSSQSKGVDNQSDIVVATAALEVGFNDPDVGAVLQHKAPRNTASYLQRKGRAGRKRIMRPWMITILSDYGRDRIAFQQYEQLINPTVKMFRLPIDNSHIQKMQAGLACLEWIGMRAGGVNLWQVLTRPRTAYNFKRLKTVKNVVASLLSDNRVRTQLQDYLQDALKLTDRQLLNVMWQPPRSVYMEFLPNLLHKLSTHWKRNGIEWDELSPKPEQPMPEFISSNLFSELFLPTLDIAVKRGPNSNLVDEWKGMNFLQGIKEFAPGRVSKRFSENYASEVDWLVPEGFQPSPGQTDELDFEIDQAFKTFREKIIELETDSGKTIKVYQPFHLYTNRFDIKELAETSNSMLIWQSKFIAGEARLVYQVPITSEWHQKLLSISFFTHEEMNPIELIRYSMGADAQLKFTKKDSLPANIRFNWTDQGQSVGIGTRLWVDSVRYEFKFNEFQLKQMSEFENNQHALRMSYTEDHFIFSPMFEHQYFFAGWVFECLVSAIFVVAQEHNLSIKEAIQFLDGMQGRGILESIPKELFQLNLANSDAPKEQALQIQLVEFFNSPQNISQALERLKPLYQPLDTPEFYDWLRLVLGNTLSAGANRVLNALLPDVGDGDINVDHQWQGEQLVIWVSEAESGGIGVIQRFKAMYLEDPLSLLNHLSRTFEAEDYEQVDFDLRYLLEQQSQSPITQDAFLKLRVAKSYQERFDANIQIQQALGQFGITATQTFNNMLHTRVLRAGSSVSSDTYLSTLLQSWVKMESELGLEIPLNIACYLLARKQSQSGLETASIKSKILGLLWPRGSAIRQSGLSFYNRFVGGKVKTERLLLQPVIREKSTIVQYQQNWLEELILGLKSSGKAVVELDQSQVKYVHSVISTILVSPVEQYGLLLYPRLRRIRRQFGKVQLVVELAEVIQ
ncbi:TPA: DEAD/DEAH box helicase [Vibrio parahaemolyticus]|nr:DEAD/DEAH box helicase [Vibrio parahaemolyticus]MDF4873605.1 protein DpdJ [Vibrio parahaemolyticus]HCG8583600.1 DEAD/DEAH box helicase [Vibrio parahaemolyticus]HCG9752874.1 DEAD/DEAH box helicase [Vibrio parahaemolyticus]HCH1656969.1 DEAD/DEAH box helicase [Vibrio parahaemolyticus]